MLVEGEGKYDFSENNLINKSGFDIGFTSGGNILVSSAYLARGDGPVLASCDPYPNPNGSPPYCKRVKYIENIRLVPPRSNVYDNSYLKEIIYLHGAIYAPMYFEEAYYNNSTYTYYQSLHSEGNHAIAIVGWDDNMYVPGAPGKGAWIVENSWGENWGDNGYFYVSYYDTSIASSDYNAYFVDKPDIDNGTFKIYQYDTPGMETGISCSSGNYIEGANIFTASNNEFIVAIGFFLAAPADYEVSIYKNCSSIEEVDLESPISTISGSAQYSGYFTVYPKTPVYVKNKESFCIKLKLTKKDSNSYPMAIEMKIPGFSSRVTIQPHQSYFKCPFQGWNDLYDYYLKDGVGNLCIKAINVTPPFPDITSNYAWALIPIIILKNENIVNGFPDGTYRPADNVSRAQMAALVQRAFFPNKTP